MMHVTPRLPGQRDGGQSFRLARGVLSSFFGVGHPRLRTRPLAFVVPFARLDGPGPAHPPGADSLGSPHEPAPHVRDPARTDALATAPAPTRAPGGTGRRPVRDGPRRRPVRVRAEFPARTRPRSGRLVGVAADRGRSRPRSPGTSGNAGKGVP